MSDNLPIATAPYNALPDHAVLALSGIDACAFAHAQFANDVVALAPGQWQWNCWLSAKGRVLAVFALLMRKHDELLLIVPDYQGASLPLALQRFVFRRKVAVSLRSDLSVSGLFNSVDEGANAQIAVFGEDLLLDLSGAGGPRSLRIGKAAVDSGEAFSRRWREYDLRHGLARLPAEQLDRWTPQQLSLDRLHAYSVKKGCYPGQEIVARTHFLGKAKRALALFESTSTLTPGENVTVAERNVGELVSTVSGNQASLALAVLPIDREPGELQCSGSALQEISLLPGLGRGVSGSA